MSLSFSIYYARGCLVSHKHVYILVNLQEVFYMYIPAKLEKINKIAKRKKTRKTKPGDIKEDDCLISKRSLDIEIMLKVCAFVIKSK